MPTQKIQSDNLGLNLRLTEDQKNGEKNSIEFKMGESMDKSVDENDQNEDLMIT